jgi:predicted transporter
MFKAVVKTIVLLAILFVMLYVGMNNTLGIDFYFPVAGTTDKTPIHQSAALIYFGVFAVGVLAGTVMTVGGGRNGGKKSAAKDK